MSPCSTSAPAKVVKGLVDVTAAHTRAHDPVRDDGAHARNAIANVIAVAEPQVFFLTFSVVVLRKEGEAGHVKQEYLLVTVCTEIEMATVLRAGVLQHEIRPLFTCASKNNCAVFYRKLAGSAGQYVGISCSLI